MGYNFNKPWRLTELENQTFPKFVQTPVGNFSVDLKLGNSGALEENCVGKFSAQGENLPIMESSSTSGSLKRVRTTTTGNVVPSCLVDGCTSDLSKCRDYHRRHKVCELHSKTSKVFIRGLEQRFCQQCSRFHSLVEFDEGKRSCRKRLDGHNRRRRKPQPDSLSINSASLFSNHQGTRYLHFGGSPLFSGTDLTSSWTGAVKTESDPMLYTNQSLLNIGTEKAGRKQFQFSQNSSSTSPISQPAFNAGSHKMFSDSNRALSLLSSPRAEAREISLVHVAQSDQNPSLNFNGLGIETGPVDSVLVSGGNNNASMQNQDLFQIGLEGSSAGGSHQTISFSWE